MVTVAMQRLIMVQYVLALDYWSGYCILTIDSLAGLIFNHVLLSQSTLQYTIIVMYTLLEHIYYA